MDVDRFYIHYQRKQLKRQQFRPVLRTLVKGLASLVDGQRCFAEEFGLSYSRVFHDDLDSFKGKDTCKVISDWLRNGEAGAEKLRNLFDDLAQHQVALVEAIDGVARESADIGKAKKNRLANKFGLDVTAEPMRSKDRQQVYDDMHQRLIMAAFVAGYARAREQMRGDIGKGHEGQDAGSALFK